MKFPFPKRVLMVRPNGFRVDYAINPYMLDASGTLQSVDEGKAHVQWNQIKQAFIELGMSVEVIEGDPHFPDMVFCANQTLPFWQSEDNVALILSRMHATQRKGEVRHFEQWARELGISTVEMTDFDFEGAGDGIWNYETRELFAGFGFRTDENAYDLIAQIINRPIHKLRLVSENFYHLDTCFAVLRDDTAAYVPQAFDDSSRQKLKMLFTHLIPIDIDEAIQNFAGNCVCPDGRHILLQPGSTKFVSLIKQAGFIPIELETSEFLKAGGSIFCMKQLLP